jgi:hypothetical protein
MRRLVAAYVESGLVKCNELSLTGIGSILFNNGGSVIRQFRGTFPA